MDAYQLCVAIALIAVMLIGAYLSTQPQGFATNPYNRRKGVLFNAPVQKM